MVIFSFLFILARAILLGFLAWAASDRAGGLLEGQQRQQQQPRAAAGTSDRESWALTGWHVCVCLLGLFGFARGGDRL